jgi:hypothetical protein
MMLLGFDLTSTRVRAVRGDAGDFPCPVPLDPPHLELPMIVNLEGRTPKVGAAGWHICRRLPHLVEQDFLCRLGESEKSAKTRADSGSALARVLQHLERVSSGSSGVALSVPAYLTRAQVNQLLLLTKKAKLPLLGSVSAPLAGALAAYADQPWFGPALVVDVDDHALTLAMVRAEDGEAELLASRALPHLSLGVWKEKLLNCLADTCIVQSRRDPRDTPQAEQTLYEQLDSLLEASRQGRMLNVAVETPSWYQNLVLQPGDAPACCAALLRQTLAEIERVFAGTWPGGVPAVVVLTAAAGMLPGLVARLWAGVEAWRAAPDPADLKTVVDDTDDTNDFGAGLLEDFGDGLLPGTGDEPAAVLVLGVDGPARAAHTLAGLFQAGAMPRGHLGRRAPLPVPQAIDAGPARLQYQGQDYPLSDQGFVLGRHRGCDLVFDSETCPMVAPRHCEIRFDRWNYLLRNRGKQGTLVNDRLVTKTIALAPGDWIRLGPDGPLLRFLGQKVGARPLHTTA